MGNCQIKNDLQKKEDIEYIKTKSLELKHKVDEKVNELENEYSKTIAPIMQKIDECEDLDVKYKMVKSLMMVIDLAEFNNEKIYDVAWDINKSIVIDNKWIDAEKYIKNNYYADFFIADLRNTDYRNNSYRAAGDKLKRIEKKLSEPIKARDRTKCIESQLKKLAKIDSNKNKIET